MITKLPFGTNSEGAAVTLYKIENADGSFVSVADYGATITQIQVPDKDGSLRNVVMGHDDVAPYERFPSFWGATIGRVGNRLGDSEFSLGGKTYKVLANNGPNHLHGGKKGFDKCMWNGEIVSDDAVRFSRLSPDGEEGYPGNLTVSVTFTFGADHRLVIDYSAQTDADTLCNLTNHSYFNLNGAKGRETATALNHVVQINAATMTACDSALLPTGEIIPVEGTPFDFRTPKTIGQDIDADNVYLAYAKTYDHNYCIDGQGFRCCAVATGDESGITMETWSDLPGMQFFTGPRNSFCMETQCYPNWNKNPHFPTIVLKKGESYETRTVYAFK